MTLLGLLLLSIFEKGVHSQSTRTPHLADPLTFASQPSVLSGHSLIAPNQGRHTCHVDICFWPKLGPS